MIVFDAQGYNHHLPSENFATKFKIYNARLGTQTIQDYRITTLFPQVLRYRVIFQPYATSTKDTHTQRNFNSVPLILLYVEVNGIIPVLKGR